MDDLQKLLDNNALWAEEAIRNDPEFFQRLVRQQSPKYLWIGCADSRVPANEIVNMQPGELFVHRNVGNVVTHSDVNAQSVIQFAVDVLQIEHIMVVGHYGCSGVHTALSRRHIGGVADYWLGHIRDVADRHQALLENEPTEPRRRSLACELNVLEQTLNVCSSIPVRDAWNRGQKLTVHGWIYRLGDGRLRHLEFSAHGEQDLTARREESVAAILAARAKYYAGR